MSWAKPLVVKELTAEEIEQEKIKQQQQRELEKQTAMLASAQRLVDRIEAAIASRSGGVSSNYGSDEQYGVKDKWDSAVVNSAFDLWKARYGPAQVLALNMHKLGPTQKFTGDRDGIWQYNFIRKISATAKGRFNIHVDYSGK